MLKPNDKVKEIKEIINIGDNNLFYGTHGNVTGKILKGDLFEVYTFDLPKFEIHDQYGDLIEDTRNPNYFINNYQSLENKYYYDEAYSFYGGLSHFYNLFELLNF